VQFRERDNFQVRVDLRRGIPNSAASARRLRYDGSGEMRR
jgi:hypothetical protein